MNLKEPNNQIVDTQGQDINNIEEEYHFLSLSDIIVPYLKILWRNRKNLLIINSSFFIFIFAILLFFVNPYYDSTITILPDYGSKMMNSGGLASLAAMAGVSLGDNTNPSDIYQNLLTSESIIEPIIYARYMTKKYSDSVNLFTYFQIEPNTDLPQETQRREMFLKAYDMVKKNCVDVSLETSTKILTVRARMPESQLSSDVINNLVQSLDNYVRTKRKSNVLTQKMYIESRISEVQDSLTVAGNRLKWFQIENRIISQSPGLTLELSKLNLQFQILQGVYSELTRQLEITKIEEIRDSPIVNVREWAREPVIKTGPKRLFILLFSSSISMIISILYFLFIDKFNKSFKQFKNILTSSIG